MVPARDSVFAFGSAVLCSGKKHSAVNGNSLARTVLNIFFGMGLRGLGAHREALDSSAALRAYFFAM